MKRLILVAALIAGIAPAMAQQKKIGGAAGAALDKLGVKPLGGQLQGSNEGGGSTGGNSTDNMSALQRVLSKPFLDVARIIGDDVSGAIELSTAIPTLQDGNGQQCWAGFSEFAQLAKKHPLPLSGKPVEDLEAARLYVMAAQHVCSNMHCGQVFTDLANAVAKAQPIPVPGFSVPSLNQLCAYVPPVVVAPPDPSLVPASQKTAPTSTPATTVVTPPPQ